MHKPLLATVVLAVSLAAFAQPYTCPRTPSWNAVGCSMYAARQPTDTVASHDLTFVYETARYHYFEATAGATAMRMHVYKHFEDPHWVANRVAHAWAGLPEVLRRSSMPLLIGIDSDGPIFWDHYIEDGGSLIVEYPASWVHEDDETLDWAFEELLVHELCHAIDFKAEALAGERLSDTSHWQRAVRRDKGHVSDYAKTNSKEDFAESCAAHILLGLGTGLRQEHRDHIEATMGNRSAFLSFLFSPWQPLVRFDGPETRSPIAVVTPPKPISGNTMLDQFLAHAHVRAGSLDDWIAEVCDESDSWCERKNKLRGGALDDISATELTGCYVDKTVKWIVSWSYKADWTGRVLDAWHDQKYDAECA